VQNNSIKVWYNSAVANHHCSLAIRARYMTPTPAQIQDQRTNSLAVTSSTVCQFFFSLSLSYSSM